MSYQKQTWRDYDDTKTELQNLQNGAVVTPERLNHIETGVANSANKQEVTAQLAQTDYEARRKKDLEDLTPRVLSAIEGGENTNFNLLSIPQNESVDRSKLVDEAVDHDKTSFLELDKSKSLFGGNYVSKRLSPKNGKWILTSGSLFETAKIEVKPNTTYSLIKKSSDTFRVATDIVLDRADNEHVTGSLQNVSENIIVGNNHTLLTGPQDVVLYVNTSITSENVLLQVVEGEQSILTIDDYPVRPKNINVYSKEEVNHLVDQPVSVKDLDFVETLPYTGETDKVFETINISDYHNPKNDGKALEGDGRITQSSHSARYSVTDLIQVGENETYETFFRHASAYDENGNHLKHTPGDPPEIERKFTTPPNTVCIRFSYVLEEKNNIVIKRLTPNDSDKNLKIPKLRVNTNQIIDSDYELPDNRFRGKRLLVSGDSITEKNFRATRNWHDFLKDWLEFDTVHNHAKSGTGISKDSAVGSNNSFFERFHWLDNHPDPDFILYMGNMNDDGGEQTGAIHEIGTFEDEDYNKESPTLYATYHKFAKDMLAKYPTVPIGFILSAPRHHTWGKKTRFEEWTKVAKEVFGHYSIPVLDLYHNSQLRPWLPENNKKYFSTSSAPNGDGTHPNALGQEVMAREIHEFVVQYL